MFVIGWTLGIWIELLERLKWRKHKNLSSMWSKGQWKTIFLYPHFVLHSSFMYKYLYIYMDFRSSGKFHSNNVCHSNECVWVICIWIRHTIHTYVSYSCNALLLSTVLTSKSFGCRYKCLIIDICCVSKYVIVHVVWIVYLTHGCKCVVCDL